MHQFAPVLVVAIGFLVLLAVQARLAARFDYRCPQCDEKFGLPPLTATVAPHRLGGSRWVRCPHCGNRSWMAPLPKQ